jgi:hypothetical protein
LRVAGWAAVPALLGLYPQAAFGQDFRDNFPEQYTSSPMGVNLQTGRFSYWLFTFAMGPFATERGFNKGGFGFPASVYKLTEQNFSGAYIDSAYVNMGNPAIALGNKVELVQNGKRPIKLSFLKGTNSSTIGFRASYVNGVFNGYTNIYNPGSEGWRLSLQSNVFVLQDKSGTRYEFANAVPGQATNLGGRISSVTYADGSRINVSFDTNGRLLFAQSNRGFALRYEYLNGGAQVKVCGFNLAQTFANASTSCSATNYVVTINNIVRSDGLLQPTSVVDLMGQTTNVTWGGTEGNFPTCITLPNSSTCEVTNTYGPQPGEPVYATKNDQVRIQADANNNTWAYSYEFSATDSEVPAKLGGPSEASKSILTAPGSGVTADYQGGFVQRITAPGGGPNTFVYNGAQLWKATYPESNILQIDRDSLGNAAAVTEVPKVGSGLSPKVSSQVFQTGSTPNTLCGFATTVLCDKPIARVDAKGNQTDFTYDPVHGGVLTKTLPAVQVDAAGPLIRPQTRYEYAQRYAWIKNASGAFVQASSPVWVLVRERSCRKTAASGQTCAGGAADEVITDYDYGPTSGAANNLLLRGVAVTADGQTLRSCYTYDANGRKLSETQPKAGLAVCP